MESFPWISTYLVVHPRLSVAVRHLSAAKEDEANKDDWNMASQVISKEKCSSYTGSIQLDINSPSHAARKL
jgi:hypothetical protein